MICSFQSSLAGPHTERWICSDCGEVFEANLEITEIFLKEDAEAYSKLRDGKIDWFYYAKERIHDRLSTVAEEVWGKLYQIGIAGYIGTSQELNTRKTDLFDVITESAAEAIARACKDPCAAEKDHLIVDAWRMDHMVCPHCDGTDIEYVKKDGCDPYVELFWCNDCDQEIAAGYEITEVYMD